MEYTEIKQELKDLKKKRIALDKDIAICRRQKKTKGQDSIYRQLLTKRSTVMQRIRMLKKEVEINARACSFVGRVVDNNKKVHFTKQYKSLRLALHRRNQLAKRLIKEGKLDKNSPSGVIPLSQVM